MGGVTVTRFRGFKFNPQTVEMIVHLEGLIRRTLPIAQGSYSNASASAGTHSAGGAVDWSGYMSTWELRTARNIGFYAWQRTPIKGLWGAHVHAGVIGDPTRSPQLKYQESLYRAGYNGLASNGRDDGPSVPIRSWHEYLSTLEDEELVMNADDKEWFNSAISNRLRDYHEETVLQSLKARVADTVIALLNNDKFIDQVRRGVWDTPLNGEQGNVSHYNWLREELKKAQ